MPYDPALYCYLDLCRLWFSCRKCFHGSRYRQHKAEGQEKNCLQNRFSASKHIYKSPLSDPLCILSF